MKIFLFFYEEKMTFFSSERVNPYIRQDSPIIFFIPYKYQEIEVFGEKLIHLKMCAAAVQETGIWTSL